MSDLNHQLRPYQAENSEYNNEFVRNYIEHVSSPAAGDGRIPDPDSTFGRFIGWTLNRSLPPVQASDATIRIGLPWHAALPELCLRSTIEFTFVYALCLAAYHIDAKGALIVVAWCISSQLLLGAVQNFAGQDSSLFFDSIARSWRSFCWVPLVALFATSGGMAVIMAVLFGLLLDTVVSFPFASGAKEAVKRAYRLVVVVLLAATFGCLIENPARLELGIRVLFLLANFALMLPLVWGMQHWFAANRYTSLSDVQGYGQEAVFYGTVFKFGSSPRGAAGLWVYVTATIAALGCTETVARSMNAIGSASAEVISKLAPLACCFGALTGIAVLNWLLIELTLHRRLPNPLGYLSSYYTTWRTLSAWLSYSAPLDHPVVFRFQRPWTAKGARGGLVSLAIAANASMTVTILSMWCVQHLIASNSTNTVDTVGSTDFLAEISRQLKPLLYPEFWLSALCAAVTLPVSLLFLTLHAVWGPTFQAYSDHFECFKDSTLPPLLNTSIVRPKAQVGGS